MISSKESRKNSLVTYNFDFSDDYDHNKSILPDILNEVSDLMSISPATIDSSGLFSIEPSPKDKSNLNIFSKNEIKKPIHSMSGLVSYGIDEDDSMDDESSHEDDDRFNLSQEKDSSVDNDVIGNSQNPIGHDNDEYFNNDCRQSDNEIDIRKQDKVEDDLKSLSGSSSSKVKAYVLTERPKGSDLAYALSRQIYNNPDEIILPAHSNHKPSPELEAKLLDLREKALNSRCNPTETILKNKAYRNPSIYEKLIQHMKIDERGTNYPPELYDPYRFGEESYYESLARNQDSAERKRLQQEANGTKEKQVKRETVVRKTKWDSGVVINTRIKK